MDFIYFRSPKSKKDCSELEAELKSKGYSPFYPHYLKLNTLYRSNICNPRLLLTSNDQELCAAQEYQTYILYSFKEHYVPINIF